MNGHFGTIGSVGEASRMLLNPYMLQLDESRDGEGIVGLAGHSFLDLVHEMCVVKRIPLLPNQASILEESTDYLNNPVSEIERFKEELSHHSPENWSIPSSNSLQSIKSCSTENGIASDDGYSSNYRHKGQQILTLNLTIGDLNHNCSLGHNTVSKSTSCEICPTSPTCTNGPSSDIAPTPSDECSHEFYENRLVLDVLLACQGLRGTYLHFDEMSNSFSFSEATFIHPALRTLALRLCPIGQLHGSIKKTLGNLAKGKCENALNYAFTTQLKEFDRMLSDLEQLAKNSFSSRQSGDSRPNLQDPLTLHRLECLLFDSRKYLEAMLMMLDRVLERKDLTVCAVLHEFTAHGDPEIQNLAYKTLAIVCRPLFALIGDWIFTGSFRDEYDEFFIKIDKKCLPENMWQSKFILRENKIPSFITPELARLIFRTGKNINFLVDICKVENVYSDTVHLSHLYKNVSVEDILRETETMFSNIVTAAFTFTSDRVIHELVNKGNLFEHLRVIKNFILQGKGDFFQYFINRINDQLLLPAKSVNNQHLQETLQYCLNAHSCDGLREYLQNIFVARAPRSETLSMWDVFCLTYKTNARISQVVSKDAMDIYRRVFYFLWQSLRVESCMKQLWIGKKMFTVNLLKIIPEVSMLTFKCNMLIGEFNNFVVQVRYYAMSEAVESEWQSLMMKLAKMKCIEEFMKEHESFVEVVNIKCLQSRHATRILLLLESVYSQIYAMEKFYSSFCTRLTREFNRRLNIRDGTSVTSADFDYVVQLDFSKYLEECDGKINELQSSTRKYIQTFLVAAETYVDPKFPCIDLSGLCYRVDFNNFYTCSCTELARTKTLKHRLSEECVKSMMSLSSSVTV